MKCPLFTVGGYDNDHLPRFGWNDCLKEECAWWDAIDDRCCFYSIHRSLDLVARTLLEIRDKTAYVR